MTETRLSHEQVRALCDVMYPMTTIAQNPGCPQYKCAERAIAAGYRISTAEDAQKDGKVESRTISESDAADLLADWIGDAMTVDDIARNLVGYTITADPPKPTRFPTITGAETYLETFRPKNWNLQRTSYGHWNAQGAWNELAEGETQLECLNNLVAIVTAADARLEGDDGE